MLLLSGFTHSQKAAESNKYVWEWKIHRGESVFKTQVKSLCFPGPIKEVKLLFRRFLLLHLAGIFQQTVAESVHTEQSWCPVLSSSWALCGSTSWHKPAEERSCPARRCCPGLVSGCWRGSGWRSLLCPQCRVLMGTLCSQRHNRHHGGSRGQAGPRRPTIEAVRRRTLFKWSSSPIQVRDLVVIISIKSWFWILYSTGRVSFCPLVRNILFSWWNFNLL